MDDPCNGVDGCPLDGFHTECKNMWTDNCPSKDANLNALRDKLRERKRILDSGERTEFESGAVRDMHEGKGDMVSIPWEAVLRLSRHYENGAKKYERFNYRKGINLSSYIDSACRHLAKYQCGCDDEDHLSAAAFNILGAMLVEEIMPELIDLPLRKGKARFCYFEVNQQCTQKEKQETL